MQYIHHILPPRFASEEMLHLMLSLHGGHRVMIVHHRRSSHTSSEALGHLHVQGISCGRHPAENAQHKQSRDLLAASAKESGDLLMKALPITSRGLRMDDNTVRVAVGLCLGTSLCHPHACHHCGAEVNHLGTHNLS